MTARVDYITGIRRLADALEANTDLPLPYDGAMTEFTVFTDTLEELVGWARVLDGKRDKEITNSDSYGFQLHGSIAGFRIVVYAPRDQVCIRRVVGTREVTEEVLDPDALAAVPKVSVTKTVEDVVWDCSPILAPREQVTA